MPDHEQSSKPEKKADSMKDHKVERWEKPCVLDDVIELLNRASRKLPYSSLSLGSITNAHGIR